MQSKLLAKAKADSKAREVCNELTHLIERNRALISGWNQALEIGINDITRNAIKDEIVRVEAQLHQLIHGKLHALLVKHYNLEMKND